MHTPKRLNLRVDSATGAQNGSSAVRLDQIQPVASIAGGHTYLATLILQVDATLVGNGAAVVGEDHVYDLLHSVIVRLPGLDRPLYELPVRAGSLLRFVKHALEGKRARAANGGAGGNITPAGGGGTAVRLHVEIPFYLPGGVRSRDTCLPIALMREAADVQIQWAAANVFGADITWSASITRCVAEVYERHEFVLPTIFSWQLFRLAQLQGSLAVSGRVLMALLEVADQGNAAGQAAIADADRDTVQVNCDGRMVVERVDTKELVTAFNVYCARSRDEELADVEAGTNPWAPIYLPQSYGQQQHKLTQGVLSINRPEYTFTGTDSTPHLLALTTDLNDRTGALSRITRSGVPTPTGFASAPDAYLAAKTFSKFAASKDADVGARLPLKLLASATGGKA